MFKVTVSELVLVTLNPPQLSSRSSELDTEAVFTLSAGAFAEPGVFPVSTEASEVVDLEVDATDVPLPLRGLDTADRPVDQQAIERFSSLRGMYSAGLVAKYIPRASSTFSEGADIAGQREAMVKGEEGQPSGSCPEVVDEIGTPRPHAKSRITVVG